MFSLMLALWATMALSFPLGKMALKFCTSPLQLLGLRMTVAGILLLFWSWYRKVCCKAIIAPRMPKKEDLFLFLQVVFFHVYLAFVPEFWALQYLDSIKVNLLFSITPFISAFLSFALLNKKLSNKKWLGLVFGLLGILLIAKTQNIGECGLAYVGMFSVPELMLLLAIISACYAWFVIRKLMHRGYSLLTINGIAFFCGGIVCLVDYFIRFGSAAQILPSSGAAQLLMIIGLLILSSNVVGYALYGALLKRHSNTMVSFSGFLCPLFGVLYSYLFAWCWPQYFAPEAISAWYILGFAVIVVGLSIFYGQEVAEENPGFFS